MFPPGGDAGPNRSKINQWVQHQLDFEFPVVQKFAPRMRYKQESIEERDAAVERLHEFLRFNYITTTELARRLGVRDGTMATITELRLVLDKAIEQAPSSRR